MLVNVPSSKKSVNCGVNAVVKEKQVDRSISDYIISNYDKLISYIRKSLGITYDKANDMLHDVYINTVQSENNGSEFYDELETASGETFEMTVSKVVYRRLKLYSKSPRYHNKTVETGRAEIYSWDKKQCGELSVDSSGNVECRSRSNRLTKIPVDVQVVPTYIREDSDSANGIEMDKFQACYTYASTFDDLDSILEMASLRDEIDFCIDVCSLHNYDIMRVLKRIDYLAKAISDGTSGTISRKFSMSPFAPLFLPLRKIIDNNDEFEESLRDILIFASNNREAYDLVMSTY